MALLIGGSRVRCGPERACRPSVAAFEGSHTLGFLALDPGPAFFLVCGRFDLCHRRLFLLIEMLHATRGCRHRRRSPSSPPGFRLPVLHSPSFVAELRRVDRHAEDGPVLHSTPAEDGQPLDFSRWTPDFFRAFPLERVTICDMLRTSGRVREKRKSAGKRSRFRRTAWFKTRVSTPYRLARSRSSMTRWPRTRKMS